MENTAYGRKDCKDDLYKFLRRFLPEDSRDSANVPEAGVAAARAEEDAAAGGGGEMEDVSGTCVFCGAPAARIPTDTDGVQRNICSLCKEESVREKELFYQLVDETLRNAQYMCSIPWKRSIRIQTHSRLEKPEPKEAGVRKKKKAAAIQAVSLEPQFVQAEIDNGRDICTFQVCIGIPAGAAAAAAVYTAAWTYLSSVVEKRKLDQEWIEGLSYWYMVYYLHCMDYVRHGSHYDQAAKQLISRSGAAFYRGLQKDRCGKYGQVFSILQDMPLARRQEKQPTAQTVSHREDKTTADSDNAGSGLTPD